MSLTLRYSGFNLFTPDGIDPEDPKATFWINSYYLRDIPKDIIPMPNGSIIWIIDNKRYLVHGDERVYQLKLYKVIPAIWLWTEDNKFIWVDELTIPDNHSALKYFPNYSS